MSLAGTVFTEVLPLFTYLENPEETVVNPKAHHIAHIVLNHFQDIYELTASFLRAADEAAPYQYQEALPQFIKQNATEVLIKVARITRLLRHVFRMHDIEHAAIREFLMLINQEATTSVTPSVAQAFKQNYHQHLLIYRQACHRDLQKATIWFALLKEIMPTAESFFPKKEFTEFKTDMIYELCAEIFNPCTNLIQRIIAGETCNIEAFNDYCVIDEKIGWILEYLPRYLDEHLSRLKTPFPENALLKLGRLKTEKDRLKSLLFFLYQSRIFLSIMNKSNEAQAITRLFTRFLQGFYTITTNRTIFTDDLCRDLNETIKPFQVSMRNLEQRKSKGITIRLFESIGRRPRMRFFHQLEDFYKKQWLGVHKPNTAVNSSQLLTQCSAFHNAFKRAKKANRISERFDELMNQFIEILKLYLRFELTPSNAEVLAAIYQVFDETLEINQQHDKEDVIAASLIRGMIQGMLDDLKGEECSLELSDESDIQEVTDGLNNLQLQPTLLFNQVFKPEVTQTQDSTPQPVVTQRKGAVFDV